MKLCINCKFYLDYKGGRCERIRAPEVVNLVTGEKTTAVQHRFASIEREPGFLAPLLGLRCGVEGRYWQPRGAQEA